MKLRTLLIPAIMAISINAVAGDKVELTRAEIAAIEYNASARAIETYKAKSNSNVNVTTVCESKRKYSWDDKITTTCKTVTTR